MEQDQGGYEVITTIGPNPGVAGQATQHRVQLGEGQSYTLKFAQDNDQISVTSIRLTAMAGSVQVETL